jgi:putative flippase GtrA
MFKKVLLHPSSHILVQLFRYGIVVAVAFPVDFGLLYVFTEKLHIYYLLSAISSFTISMIVNFALSIAWVFKGRTKRALWKEITAFFIIGFVGLALTAFLVWFLTSVFSIHYLVSKLIAVCFVFVWSFGARRVLFEKHASDYIEFMKKRLRIGVSQDV